VTMLLMQRLMKNVVVITQFYIQGHLPPNKCDQAIKAL
jgi:hypothetical protein